MIGFQQQELKKKLIRYLIKSISVGNRLSVKTIKINVPIYFYLLAKSRVGTAHDGFTGPKSCMVHIKA